MCGSRRDQELDSHEELDNHVRVKARPRAGLSRTVGQSCGVQSRSRSGLSRRVGQSFAGPGEIKKREASWTLTKSWTIIYGSRRDQDERSELNSHEEFDNHLRVQAS